MKLAKGPAREYFKRLNALASDALEAEAKYHEALLEVSAYERVRDTLRGAAGTKAVAAGKEYKRAIQSHLQEELRELSALNQRKIEAYREYRRLLAKARLAQPIPRWLRGVEARLAQMRLELGAWQYIVQWLKSADQQSDECAGVDFSSCTPVHLYTATLLRYWSLSYSSHPSGYLFQLPPEDTVANSDPPPTVRVKVVGVNGNSNGQIWWGMEVEQARCGIEFSASCEMTGLVDIGGWGSCPLPAVYLRLGITVHQYRGYSAPFSEYRPLSFDGPGPGVWIPHRTWFANPANLGFDDMDSRTQTENTPGVHTISPFTASIFERICDVQPGDKFVFWYSFGAQADCSAVDLTFNNAGTLVIRPPVIAQYT